ncbi:MAG: carbon storage regulator CsrA [Candidatus Gastranaerophilales bacterium]|nr:carbon storage regulator CsrA [Candidatus Gastranaerophilales bacterium]
MLVLTRKTGQKLIINDNIEVIILETRGDSVKIGIKAPRSVSIYREEIYEEIKKANYQSGKNALVSDLDSALSLLENTKQVGPINLDKLPKVKALNEQNIDK